MLEYVNSSKGKPMIILNGFLYVKDKQRGPKTYWKCKDFYSLCKSRAITIDGEVIRITQEHNHHLPTHNEEVLYPYVNEGSAATHSINSNEAAIDGLQHSITNINRDTENIKVVNRKQLVLTEEGMNVYEGGAEEEKLNSSFLLGGPSGLQENNDVDEDLPLPASPEHFLAANEETNSQYATPTSESYKLRHNNHLSLVLESLANDESFMDVTLTAQGQSIKAHKSVLSAVSPYFKGVLTQNPCQHPIIIMPRDIKFEELNNIVSYIYRGEITISAEELSSLIKTAEVLQITGLITSEQSALGGLAADILEGVRATEAEYLNNQSQSKGKTPKKTKESVKNKKNSQQHLSSESTQINPVDFLNQDMVTVKQELKDEPDVEEDPFGCWTEPVNFKSSESDNTTSQSPANEVPPDSIAIKNESSPFTCPHCSEVKRPLHILETHLSSKHPTKPSFVCKNCVRVFLRPLLYQNHCKTCRVH